MENETCSTCKFRLPNPNDLNQQQCRRNPPTVLLIPEPGPMGQVGLSVKSAYPPIHLKQPACGEHRPKVTIQ